jgi:hypothetical protein
VTQLPTNRTAASSIAEHTADHNTLHGQHNGLDGHAADTAAHDVDATIADAIAALVAAAPGTLDTLNELAAALGDDADFAATITTALAGKSATGHGHGGTYEPVATAHHARHEPGGADAMAVDAAAATGSLRTLGTGATQAAVGSHAHSGASVANTPAGNIAATTVQAALNELDSEKEIVGVCIPKSLIDAAGDLIVGTANDTAGRLAMGSALQTLRVNAGATALEFAAPAAAGDLTFARFAFR